MKILSSVCQHWRFDKQSSGHTKLILFLTPGNEGWRASINHIPSTFRRPPLHRHLIYLWKPLGYWTLCGHIPVVSIMESVKTLVKAILKKKVPFSIEVMPEMQAIKKDDKWSLPPPIPSWAWSFEAYAESILGHPRQKLLSFFSLIFYNANQDAMLSACFGCLG